MPESVQYREVVDGHEMLYTARKLKFPVTSENNEHNCGVSIEHVSGFERFYKVDLVSDKIGHAKRIFKNYFRSDLIGLFGVRYDELAALESYKKDDLIVYKFFFLNFVIITIQLVPIMPVETTNAPVK